MDKASDCCTKTTAAIKTIAPIIKPKAVISPVVLNPVAVNIKPYKVVTKDGNPAIIPTKINIDIPFPTPLVVICSPNHIKSAVPATSENTTKIPVNHPGFIKIPLSL